MELRIKRRYLGWPLLEALFIEDCLADSVFSNGTVPYQSISE
jgi:hypothetical protein